jgi:hypothetical protein
VLVDLAPTTDGCARRSSSGRPVALARCSSFERLTAVRAVHLAPTSSLPCAVCRPPPLSASALPHPASTSWLSKSGVSAGRIAGNAARRLICSPRNPPTLPLPWPPGWRISRRSDLHELGRTPPAPRSLSTAARSTWWSHTRPRSGWRVPRRQAKVATRPALRRHTGELGWRRCRTEAEFF